MMLAVLLAACASTGPAPVEDRSIGGRRETVSPSRRPVAVGSYRVVRGDTLYSIAFRNGLDFRELASWNGIGAPYTIYPGQELRLSPGRPASGASRAAVAAAPKNGNPPAAVPKPAPFAPVAERPAAAPAVSQPAAPATPSIAGNPAVTPPSAPPPSPPVETNVSGDVAWRWPADGSIVGSFASGDQTRQGIDIAGKAGDPVRAAAAGTVVYSGNGLIGYGELIIIKHNASFLSAYGHNRKRLVKEGDRVASGQVIAEMGSSSANRDSLHFEIRKNGKPVNPTDYLPRR